MAEQDSNRKASFTLRTTFAVLFIVVVILGFVANQYHWAQQREVFLAEQDQTQVVLGETLFDLFVSGEFHDYLQAELLESGQMSADPPGFLQWLGAEGHPEVQVWILDQSESEASFAREFHPLVQRARYLFPEANLITYIVPEAAFTRVSPDYTWGTSSEAAQKIDEQLSSFELNGDLTPLEFTTSNSLLLHMLSFTLDEESAWNVWGYLGQLEPERALNIYKKIGQLPSSSEDSICEVLRILQTLNLDFELVLQKTVCEDLNLRVKKGY